MSGEKSSGGGRGRIRESAIENEDDAPSSFRNQGRPTRTATPAEKLVRQRPNLAPQVQILRLLLQQVQILRLLLPQVLPQGVEMMMSTFCKQICKIPVQKVPPAIFAIHWTLLSPGGLQKTPSPYSTLQQDNRGACVICFCVYLQIDD
jgi:hypothetical protein